MKKTNTKLGLRKETVRALVKRELKRVIAGEDDCPRPTHPISGCHVQINADTAPGGGD